MRPLVLMRIVSTLSTVALFLAVASIEIAPMAAPPTPKAAPTKKSVPVAAKFNGAKYEPARGVYLGAAIDFSNLQGKGSKTGEMADAMGAWEAETWRENAIYLSFTPFPHEDGSFPTWDSDPKGWASISDFCNATSALDAAPMITLEPMKPRVFVDGWAPQQTAYEATKALAIKMGKWGKPAFVRFAHEMNGSWYPWAEWSDKNRNQKRDPGEDTGFYAADYRKAYRNMAAMFRKYAPNVALVWCPNSGLLGGARRDVFAPWYPGDDVVDWVGLDIYERGWTMPMPGAHLWGGQFAFNLTRDMADDPNTPDKNESVNFYETYAAGKNKPLMLCETGATLSYRTDIPDAERALMDHEWKMGHWNNVEYGWMQSIYGTSHFPDYPLLQPIDKAFPLLKGIIWFQIGKNEYIPVQQKLPDGTIKMVWFENAWADYRIGGHGGIYDKSELEMYRRLTNSSYFLSKIVK